MHRKQLTHIFSLLLLFAACFLGGTLLARATASEAGESDNAGNETTGAANEAAGAVNETTGAASETAGAANEEDASASKSWGLSYQEEGKRPQGTDTLEDLAAHGAYYARDTEEKVLYLTFDCGYENGNTAKILDTLKEKNVPAAFFLTGDFLRSAPDLAKRIADEGHTAGNHTEHHPDMSAITDPARFEEELDSVAAAYQEITGQPLDPYFRPPQGKYSIQSLDLARQAGYSTIFWSLAHVDWQQDAQPGREETFDKLIGRVHPGAIILLHTTSASNTQYLGELIDEWGKCGYVFRRLGEFCGKE